MRLVMGRCQFFGNFAGMFASQFAVRCWYFQYLYKNYHFNSSVTMTPIIKRSKRQKFSYRIFACEHFLSSQAAR